MEALQIPDAEFKIMVIKMLKELRRRIDDLRKIKQRDSKH